MLLDEGWRDGLSDAEFRAVAAHLVDCPQCASTARSWRTVDSSLKTLADLYSRATPRTAIAARVSEAIARERAVPAPADQSEEFQLSRFLERLRREGTLRERIARAGDPGARLDVLVALGREQGFGFTEATVCHTLARQRAANDGELTDDQLEAVAGGASAEFALLQDLLGSNPPAAPGKRKPP